MKKSTLIGCFVGLLALTMNAQITQPSNSTTLTGTTKTEVQQKSSSSIESLLVRYDNVGKYSGAISDHFTMEEQRMLRSHFSIQQSTQSRQVINEGVRPSSVLTSPAARGQYTPLFTLRAADRSSSSNVILPAAYFNNSATTMGENAGVASNGERNTNVTIPFTGTYYNSMAPNAMLYDNGPYWNVAGSPNVSLLESSLGMNSLGAGAQFTAGNSVADDVVFTDDVEISTIDLFAYQSFETAPTVNAVYLQVWDGDPSGSGASVVWGDLTTNILDVAVYANANRASETTPNNADRQLNRVTALTTGLTLTAGTYWIEYTFGGSGASGPWAPPIVILGQTTTGNALQNQNGMWIALEDSGTFTPQGLPFVIYGDVVGGGGIVYCIPEGTNSARFVDNFSTTGGSENISNLASGFSAGGYGDFYDTHTVTQEQDGTVNFSVDIMGGTAGFRVWVDWNQDGVFDAIDEVVYASSSYANSQSGTITVPADALAGDTRMRIVSHWLSSSGDVDPCATGFTYGEFEDYKFTVAGGGGGGTVYCTPEGTNSARFVNNFSTTGGDDNISNMASGFSAGGYGDFYDTHTVAQEQDGTVNFSVDIMGGTAGFRVWVDWNQDGVFDTTEEVAYASSGYLNSHTGTISVPSDALEGDTRMRIVSHWLSTSGDVDPCATGFTYGEFEDYKFTVASGGGGGPGPLTTVYGINNNNQDLIGFGVSTPQTTEVFGTSPNTLSFENAGAIDPANPTTGYVLDNIGQFFSFDVTTGIYTALGSIPTPHPGWVGMEFDQTSGILYAIDATALYIIDPVAVSATLVGAMSMPASDFPIALAIDGAGVGYTYDIGSDTLHSVDLATGASTPIGNIGFDANFGQGMAWDPTTDTVYMSAFNNDTFQAEWRSVDLSTGMTTLIGPIVTTAASGIQVGWSSVGETLNLGCPEPTNLVVSNVTPTSADLSWTAEPNASNGYIWYVFDVGANPTTDTPVATGTTPAGTTSATATGLSGGFNYDFYVVADCASGGLSQFAGPVTFATPPACGGKFYDTGGPNANYSNNENVTTVISPDNTGDQVTVTFLSFHVEANWDALYVYDGPDASSPIISSGNPATNSGFPAGGYYGTNIPGPFTSSHPSGALTFVFRSEGSVNYAGWEADVTCAPTPPPNDKIANSIDVDEIGFPYTDPQVNMPAATTEDGNPNGCDLTGANGVWYNFVPFADGTANAMIVTPGGASSVTFYTAPNENAVETDLTLVPQNSNQCAPGTSASINTVAGQAYYVFVLNNGAVTDIVIDGTNLGVSDNTIEGFSFYPNPSSTILNLKSVDNIESIALFNMLGQRVIDTQVNSTTSQIDVSGLATGTYLMRVMANGQTGTYRVIKN